MSIEKQSVSEENLQGSWVELNFNNGGGSTPKGASEDQSASTAPSGDLEKMLLDAQHESGRSSSRGSLPCDRSTPSHLRRGSEVHSSGGKNSSQSEEDYLERRKEVEILMKKNADWIWDWSSRPENLPPKEFVLRHPKRSSTLSMRNTSVMKKGGIFSAEFLKVFLPSLVLSHILAVGLGVYIGRRITTSGTF
ncbi:BCL2/adenovirus E1B 19 kDa protein-interacting protein 3-like isoform X2 [Carassius carassius]|uniref:BCL2/adenovirus E1B 19 kDa protein-interacting protein 3-like isoform X2 n=1 Tax=Carassius carassius TaxID=217509 RepID=UPI002868E6E8|nr:BCL2/adenovirus E1B 19 kDa protein-interacting protein 3-like isoform X2 [Carassius carassius]